MNTPNDSTGGCCPPPPCSRLLSDGWREYPDQFRKYARCFFKRFDTPTRCICNDDKVGMQICVAVSEHEGRSSYEIDLHGELPDGTWIKLHNHGMPEDIEAGLATIPRLLATWEFICANNQILTPLTAPTKSDAEMTPSRAVVVSDACSAFSGSHDLAWNEARGYECFECGIPLPAPIGQENPPTAGNTHRGRFIYKQNTATI